MAGSDFTTEALLAGQGIYKRGPHAIASSNAFDDEVDRYNAKVDAEAAKYPGAIRVNSVAGAGLGYKSRLANKGELKNFHSEARMKAKYAKEDHAKHSEKAIEHAEKADEARKAGKEMKAKFHEGRSSSHESKANRALEAHDEATKTAKKISDDLKRRFQHDVKPSSDLERPRTGRFQVSSARQARMASAGVKTGTGGEPGGQAGHPFFGNQHTGGIPGGR